MLAISSYAEVESVIVGKKLAVFADKPEITISLDLIECDIEAFYTECGSDLKPYKSQPDSSKVVYKMVYATEDARDILTTLKKDKNTKVMLSVKVTTYPNNKAIVDNKEPVEYLISEKKDDVTNLRKETKYIGNLFEVTPSITQEGDISVDFYYWVGEFKDRLSKNKNIPQELGYPIIDSRSSASNVTLKDGETIIVAGLVKESVSATNSGVKTTERKAFMSFISADINKSPPRPDPK
jgi:hypothetical protein